MAAFQKPKLFSTCYKNTAFEQVVAGLHKQMSLNFKVGFNQAYV